MTYNANQRTLDQVQLMSASAEETVGQRLQRLREAANLTQVELARIAKVPIGTLRNWEQDRRIPRLDTAALVARALGVTIDELAEPLKSAAPDADDQGEGEKG